MIKFITGCSGSGKTTFVKKEITKIIDKTEKKVMLIVPEQFSFETEREINHLLGKKNKNRAIVLSFTRLANMIFKTYGGLAGKTAGKTEKLVFMDLAINEVADTLEYYTKASKYPSFLSTMLDCVDEIKNSGVEGIALLKSASKIGNDTLVSKSKDIVTIFDTYNAILSASAVDPSDNIQKAVDKISNTDFFS